MTTKFLGIFLSFAWITNTIASTGPFKVKNLPIGKTLTLPKPAMMQIPQDMPVYLTSEDIPQAIKISLMNTGRGRMNIAIYNNDRKLTKEFRLKRGDTVLYTFDGLTSIKLVPQGEGKYTRGLKLRLESNKPLGVRR